MILLADESIDRQAEIVARAIHEHTLELFRAFAVITPAAMRVRR